MIGQEKLEKSRFSPPQISLADNEIRTKPHSAGIPYPIQMSCLNNLNKVANLISINAIM